MVVINEKIPLIENKINKMVCSPCWESGFSVILCSSSMHDLQGGVQLPRPIIGGKVVQPPVRLFDNFHVRAPLGHGLWFLFYSDPIVFKA